MNTIRFKLCVMMLLEFIIWGAWLPLLGQFSKRHSISIASNWHGFLTRSPSLP